MSCAEREAQVVAGGTPGALVAADVLAARGRSVRLLLPAKGAGGGFLPLRRDGYALELGMRLLELGHEDRPATAPALEAYDPGMTGHLPFTPLIEAWVRDVVGDRLRPLAPAEMVLPGGTRTHDLFLSCDPGALRSALSPAERAEALRELGAATPDAGVLASGLDGLDLEHASRANHGDTVHERLVAPLARKFAGPRAGQRVLAALRRKVWMPLLWPRSVREACADGEIGFRPRRPVHTVAGPAGVGELFTALLERLHARPEVTIERVAPLTEVTQPNGHVSLAFADGRSVDAVRPVLAHSPRELFAAAGVDYAPERMRTVVAWAAADEADLLDPAPITHVVDPALDAARVSAIAPAGAPPGTRVICVELRNDLAEEAIEGATRASLEGAGLLVKGAPLRPITQAVARTFPVPTGENLSAFHSARAAFAERDLRAELVGGATAFTGDLLNEQIVQGLRAAERLA